MTLSSQECYRFMLIQHRNCTSTLFNNQDISGCVLNLLSVGLHWLHHVTAWLVGRWKVPMHELTLAWLLKHDPKAERDPGLLMCKSSHCMGMRISLNMLMRAKKSVQNAGRASSVTSRSVEEVWWIMNCTCLRSSRAELVCQWQALHFSCYSVVSWL